MAKKKEIEEFVGGVDPGAPEGDRSVAELVSPRAESGPPDPSAPKADRRALIQSEHAAIRERLAQLEADPDFGPPKVPHETYRMRPKGGAKLGSCGVEDRTYGPDAEGCIQVPAPDVPVLENAGWEIVR